LGKPISVITVARKESLYFTFPERGAEGQADKIIRTKISLQAKIHFLKYLTPFLVWNCIEELLTPCDS
jgi:hypothetical protein